VRALEDNVGHTVRRVDLRATGAPVVRAVDGLEAELAGIALIPLVVLASARRGTRAGLPERGVGRGNDRGDDRVLGPRSPVRRAQMLEFGRGPRRPRGGSTAARA